MVAVLGALPCRGQEGAAEKEDDASGLSPWQRGWYVERGIELPRPFGIAVNFISMERDIEVTDVTVKVGNRPPESISETP